MDERRIYLWHYLFAFLIATCLMISVFLFTHSISHFTYQAVLQDTRLIEEAIISLKKIHESISCTADNLYEASSLLDKVGMNLNLLEERLGKEDVRVRAQKKLYAELEFEHFLIVKKFVAECNANLHTLLFFYSNRDTYAQASEQTGFILSTLKNQMPTEIMIYSFDYDLNSSLVTWLIQNYSIPAPSLVVVDEQAPRPITHIRDIHL